MEMLIFCNEKENFFTKNLLFYFFVNKKRKNFSFSQGEKEKKVWFFSLFPYNEDDLCFQDKKENDQ